MEISVIIPFYDVEKYLPDCLDSVTGQTLREIEIILVDDGSPDRCGAIANAYAEKDPRMQVIHQTNHGVGHARNKGIEKATGKYLYILDSDDWLSPDALEKMYARAEADNADIVMVNFYHVYQNESKSEPRINTAKPPPWLRFGGCGAWLRLIRRELVVRHPDLRFPEDIWTGQDTVFTLMLDLFTENIIFLDEPLVYYRHRTKSKQRSLKQQREKVITSVTNAMRFWSNFIETHPELRRDVPEVFIMIFGNLLSYLKLPFMFKCRLVFKYRKLFRALDKQANVNWARTPRVWWFWKLGLYVPPTKLRCALAALTGKRHQLSDMEKK